ncbi:phenoloxidase-activating factor 2-like [Galleria mellonella]|uniref:Phenoloxidase-activating factor 2-like n=2 Tax=Galleria mellonella TaxID=7137 RepID=A0A6J1WQ96_GALME|nr:phenoloxidase-activating factor 2-like [Galleria mellonella]XP_026757517.2 phenoloxidase-activating factor 2-like [Galleria mellonella]
MLPIVLLVITSVLAQDPTIEPSVLIDVFGPPPATQATITTSPKLEDITVRPTDKNEFVDKNGDTCKCVPYYLCNDDLIGVDVNNASVTGFGVLDIRFGEDECQESVERCCTSPKEEKDVVIPARPLKGCGYRNPKGLDFTITGGSGGEAEFGEFPWVVALLNSMNESYIGVGVLIHPQVVMTGAHVVHNYGAGNLKIRAGEWDTQTTGERLKSVEKTVVDVTSHPEFQRKNLKYNVALLKLESPLELAEHINVICMPGQDESFDQYKSCVANGWGKDVFGLQGRYAVILKKVQVDMVPHTRCEAQLKKTRLGSKFRLHSSFVCAGGEEGKDTCQGDGGAPLACPIGGDRYKLTGLVSWGIGCGQKDVPAVYANVPMFRKWVDDKMAAWGYDISGYSV